MKTCASCRFKAAPRDTFEPYSTCTRIVHGNGSEYSLQFRADKSYPAMVTDGSGYAARFNVLPSFGCILHEDKEEKVKP